MSSNIVNSLLFVLLMKDYLRLCITNNLSDQEQNSTESGTFIPTDNNDDLSELSTFGLLHTLEKYAEWAAKEEVLVQTLSQRQKLVKTELIAIQRYLRDYHETSGPEMKTLKSSHKHSEQRARMVGSRGILSHALVHRYVTDGEYLRQFFTSTAFKENEKNLHVQLELEDKENWMFAEFVGWDDSYISSVSFIHINEIYGFHPSKMTKGIKLDTTNAGNLRPLHAAELGVVSMFRRQPYISIEWLEVASNNLNQNFAEVNVAKDVVKLFRDLAVQQHNRDYQELIESQNGKEVVNYERFLTLYNNPVTKDEPPENRVSVRRAIFSDLHGMGGVETNEDSQFMNLCLGNEPHTPEMQQKLKCYYEQKRHPYLFINPVKVEQLSEEPPILQFYEMVGNRTMEKIKQENRKKVVLSGVYGKTSVEETTTRRTSAGVFIDDDDIPDIVFDLAEAVSGLKIRGSSEPVQFAEYTYGRFYVYHIDALTSEEDISVLMEGNRVATILYYLDTATLGGTTPFTQAGVNARSIKGSAVFWYNLYRNGTIRDDTQHGACPVVHGHKIIINHWIRYFGNWKTFPCSLNQFE